MNLQNLSDEEKTLAAKIRDYIGRCNTKGVAVYTDFLSDREQAIALEAAKTMGVSEGVVVYGGFEDAERAVVGFLPEYAVYLQREEIIRDFPITALKINCSGFREHTHRDFLGSILALGIKRSVTGDIIVGDKGFSAIVFVHNRMVDFLCENLTRIGRDGVTVSVANPEETSSIIRNYEVIRGTSASLRLDAIISEVLNLSRDKSQTLISSGLVTVNHEEVSDKSRMLDLHDVFTVRGYGKYVLSSVGDKNRKDRIRFEVSRFI